MQYQILKTKFQQTCDTETAMVTETVDGSIEDAKWFEQRKL